LPSGLSVVTHLLVAVTPGAGPTLAVSATATSDTFDPSLLNNTVAASTAVNGADLRLLLVAAPDPVNAGEPLTYTVGLDNLGGGGSGAEALNPRFSISLASGTSFLSADNGFSCVGVLELACASVSGYMLPSGLSVVTHLLVAVTPGAGPTLAVSATATSDTFDPDPANNSNDTASLVTQVAAPPPI